MHDVTTAYSPVSNDCAEQLTRLFLYMPQTMMLTRVEVKEELRSEGVKITCFIRSRLVTQICKENCTPHGVIHKHKQHP